jgi:G3E family GTPase
MTPSLPPTPRNPVVILCGLDPTDLLVAGINLQCSLPGVLVVRHEVDLVAGTLRRLVSDGTGLLEDTWIELDHLCLTCALRHEIAPTLARWVRARPGVPVLLCLPATLSPLPVADLLERHQPGSELAGLVELRSVVATVGGADLEHDLLGDDLLAEREAFPEIDRRSVGEVIAEQVEYADLVVAADGVLPRPSERLLRELVRDDTVLLPDPAAAGPEHLLSAERDARRARRHVDPTRRSPSGAERLTGDVVLDVSREPGSAAWTVAVDSWRPFHPTRLLENVETLGGGALRGRGCFWLPTRPGALAVWNGAGGQLSIGTAGSWGARTPRTRLLVTGVGGDRDVVATCLRETLATEAELAAGRSSWGVGEDGFEQWLGDYPASA